MSRIRYWIAERRYWLAVFWFYTVKDFDGKAEMEPKPEEFGLPSNYLQIRKVKLV